MMRTISFGTLLLTLITALTLLLAGCEERREAIVCTSLAQKICEKWFDCWPVISEARWTDVAACRSAMQDNCSNSEVLYGCDLDNADLINCDQNVADSPCGSLPQSCTDMIECYY